MTETVANYRWSIGEFVRAWEAGAFDHRVELVDGEVWPVVIGDWHGDCVFRIGGLLRRPGVIVTGATLASAGSLPDPDCWVRRSDAQPSGSLSDRLNIWSPADVLLVVEVSDETMMADLSTKARIYGTAGWPVYWVVTKDVVYEHVEPTSAGYRHRIEYRRGDQLPLRYADTFVPVDELLA